MMWFAIGLALALCAGAGLFFGAMKAAQSPAFYAEAVKMVIAVVLPEILKRKSPEEEAAWRKEIARGGDGGMRRGHREH